MLDFMKALSASASGMKAQSQRLRVVTENVANADTPGYQRKLVRFEQIADPVAGGHTVRASRTTLDPSPLKERYEPNHPLADEEGIVKMSNVNLITEITDARQARRSYEANVSMFDQTRRMYSSVLELLRR